MVAYLNKFKWWSHTKELLKQYLTQWDIVNFANTSCHRKHLWTTSPPFPTEMFISEPYGKCIKTWCGVNVRQTNIPYSAVKSRMGKEGFRPVVENLGNLSNDDGSDMAAKQLTIIGQGWANYRDLSVTSTSIIDNWSAKHWQITIFCDN